MSSNSLVSIIIAQVSKVRQPQEQQELKGPRRSLKAVHVIDGSSAADLWTPATPTSPIFIVVKSTRYKIYHGNHFNTRDSTVLNIFIMHFPLTLYTSRASSSPKMRARHTEIPISLPLPRPLETSTLLPNCGFLSSISYLQGPHVLWSVASGFLPQHFQDSSGQHPCAQTSA